MAADAPQRYLINIAKTGARGPHPPRLFAQGPDGDRRGSAVPTRSAGRARVHAACQEPGEEGARSREIHGAHGPGSARQTEPMGDLLRQRTPACGGHQATRGSRAFVSYFSRHKDIKQQFL